MNEQDPILEIERMSRRRRRIAFGVVGVIVVLIAGFVVYQFSQTCGGFGTGVTNVDGECAGVTDGTYVFDPKLARVQNLIVAENKFVDDQVARSPNAKAVTIAMLSPMTASEGSPIRIDEIRNQVIGAYTAQYRANHSTAVGDKYPLIRLVLANEGSRELQWEPVVEQLADMVDDDAPLVGVVGLGVSTRQTESGAKYLAARDIPMVASITTADQLNYRNIRGFMRVAPNNREYVASLRRYLDDHPDLDTAIVLYDANSAGDTDLFTASLRADFDQRMRDLIKYETQTFVGASLPSDARPGMFGSIVTNICAVRPKVVLFAGRQVDIETFLDSLGSRTCSDLPITVLTGGTDLGALNDEAEKLRREKITVVYAAATDSDGWAKDVAGTPPNFGKFRAVYEGRGFDLRDLADGGAIATHDALLTAAMATRLAASSIPGRGLPSAKDVQTQLTNLNQAYVVPGAGGNLSFSQRGADTSNPKGKPIPVLKIPTDSGVDQNTPPYYTK